jgi:hypothetical protein
MVAEPIGPMIKLFMTYDLLRGDFAAATRAKVERWARQWIAVGERSADASRDYPWVPDVTINGLRTNVAAYGNSAFGQRAMAVWAAAAAGADALNAALAWNWQHTTARGHVYGWDDVLDHSQLPGANGETLEGRVRQSVGYGLFGWSDLLLIADVAKHAGFSVNLFTHETARGNSLLDVVPFYAPILMGTTGDPYPSEDTSDLPSTLSSYRAKFETLVNNCPAQLSVCALASRVVNTGGPAQRALNEDGWLMGWNAVTAQS